MNFRRTSSEGGGRNKLHSTRYVSSWSQHPKVIREKSAGIFRIKPALHPKRRSILTKIKSRPLSHDTPLSKWRVRKFNHLPFDLLLNAKFTSYFRSFSHSFALCFRQFR